MGLIDDNYWTSSKGRELAIKYEIPILFVSFLYIPIILLLKKIMQNRKDIEAKGIKIVWNLTLSSLSFFGVLLIIIYDKNILKRIIVEETEYTPVTRAVIAIFTLTKALEYGDTIFLILKKKQITFLHVYHHATVVIYCLYSQKHLVSHAHYFVFFNLVVHSIMYFYFGFFYIKRNLMIKMRKFITCLQIVQMFVGIFISLYAIKHVENKVHLNNAILSFILYLTYAFLFLNFFFNNYYQNIKSNVAIYLIAIHILAVVGFVKVCNSKDFFRLFIEVCIGCIFTITLLSISFYLNKSIYQHIKNKLPDKNFIEETNIFVIYKKKYDSNRIFINKAIRKVIRTGLLCFNCLVTNAHDNILLFVNFYSEKIKKMKNENSESVYSKESNTPGNSLYERVNKKMESKEQMNQTTLKESERQTRDIKKRRGYTDNEENSHRNINSGSNSNSGNSSSGNSSSSNNSSGNNSSTNEFTTGGNRKSNKDTNGSINDKHDVKSDRNCVDINNGLKKSDIVKNRFKKILVNAIKNIYNASIISYLISKTPKEKNLVTNYENEIKNINTKIKHINTFKQMLYKYLFYIICLLLPIYYGLKVYDDALLGLCVHGALRWVIELHWTKRVFDKKKPY